MGFAFAAADPWQSKAASKRNLASIEVWLFGRDWPGITGFFSELALSLSQLNGSGDLKPSFLDVTKKDVTSAIRCHTLHPTLSCVIECHDPQVVSFNAAISACEKGGGSVELMQASKVVLCGYVYVASYVKSFLL